MSTSDASAPKREPVDTVKLREICERATDLEFLCTACTALPACLDLIEDLRKALGRLAHEATGFLSMASREAHGTTNIRVMERRIQEAYAALKRGEPKEGM
jgi:hypothetical protein